MTDPTTDPPIDPGHLREALGHYPTGVALVTSLDATEGAAEPVGLLVGSFGSVSMDPPLVSFVAPRTSPAYDRLRRHGAFCVNVLAADQEGLCRAFTGDEVAWAEDGAWKPAASGVPVLDDAVAWVSCTLDRVVEAGDRDIVIGRVQELEVVRPTLPLLSFQGGYGQFTLPSLLISTDPDLIHGIRLAAIARPELDAIATDLSVECAAVTPAGEDAVFVAMASGSPEPARVSLGFRVPLHPPVGAVFIANLGSVAVNDWLDRLPPSDGAAHADAIRQLERVRERGYSLSLEGDHGEWETFTIVRDYSSPGRLPEHERRFHELIHATAPLYEPDLAPEAAYDVHSIVVPVPGPLGVVQLALRIAGVPRGLTGAEVEAYIDRVRAGAARVAELIADAQETLAP